MNRERRMGIRKARNAARNESERRIYSLDGRRCINAKLPIHTKSPGFGVKRGEYISPGINLFELCLHRNNCDAARRFGAASGWTVSTMRIYMYM